MFRFTRVASALWLWVVVQQPADVLASPAKDLENQSASQRFFTNGTVCEIHMEMPTAGIESLKREPRKPVHARILEGTNIYVKAGVHLKGNSTFRPIDGEKPSFTIKFNFDTPGQRFHGLAKISLNNSIQDPSYINEPLCTELFRGIGVPVARISHARVWLNQRYLGVYILVEGLTKDFLKLNFSNSDGNLYEGNSQDIDEDLPQINGTNTSRADLKALADIAREADAGLRWQRLQKALDMNGFISMMAGEVLMSAWDGYYNDANNYRIYHDTKSARMVMMPHGMDNMWQVDDARWRPELHTLLGKAILQTSQGQNLYRERFWTLFDGPFRAELLLVRVDQISQRLRPAIAKDGNEAVKQFDKEVATVRRRITARMDYLAQELSTLSHRLSFSSEGIAKLAGWQAKAEAGPLKLDHVEKDGRPALHVQAAREGKGTWLTRVQLDPGNYVFQGEACTLGLVASGSEPGAGAGLRRAGEKPGKRLSGDSPWTRLESEFEVRESGTVELRCELQCKEGEAWFDTTSLRLRRVAGEVETLKRQPQN